MFVDFFYLLRDSGIPVTPTSFLKLHEALKTGLVKGLDDFYSAARTILVKSERYFDIYDQLFAHFFRGAELPDFTGVELEATARALLEEWLKDPEALANALGMTQEQLKSMSPDELIKYFLDRLKEQTEAHHGGSRWIGTRGTSPVGHSGFHPGGMRVGGRSMNKSAVKVAMERRYRDYSLEAPLTQAQIGEALKRLRRLVPVGPKDRLNIDETIRATTKNAGEIEIVFDRSLRDRLKVILMIDNGGWSMDPYVEIVQLLFNYARAQFKDLKTFFFHNTIYDFVWEDPPRRYKAQRVRDFAAWDPESRLIIVGDASMAPYELMATDGSIHIEERSGLPSIDQLNFLRKMFRHSVWLNPTPLHLWPVTRTIGVIANIFPMFELTLDGLDRAVASLMQKN
ncbi:MAG: vWA domain-containing protein [Desulfomonilaceae bacterium]